MLLVAAALNLWQYITKFLSLKNMLFPEINPLNVHGLRRVDFCPPHFARVPFDLYTNEQDIIDWVYTNLHGRFYFGDYISIDGNGKRQMCKLLAFENHSESTYLGLFLDQINGRNDKLW